MIMAKKIKRRKTDMEHEFDMLGDACYKVFYRAIMFFPIMCAIAGLITYKLLPTLTDVVYFFSGDEVNLPVWVIAVSSTFIIGLLMYWILIGFIYEDVLNRYIHNICYAILANLKKKGEITDIHDYRSMYKRRKYIKDLRQTLDGKWIDKD
jgi:hypothetical protein